LTAQRALQEVTTRVVALRTPALVGVDGPDGAGKTTFADALAATVTDAGREVVRASVDDFHHPRAHRHADGRTPETVWMRHFDNEALLRELLDPWRAGAGAEYRRRWHDLATDRPVREPQETVPQDAILIVDGLFLQRDELRGAWDLAVYLDVPDDLGIARVIARDGPLDDPERYVGAQRIYREQCVPRDRAALVIDNTDPQRPVIVG